MPAEPYDPYAKPNPWWQQQQAPRPPVQFGQPPPPAPPPKQWWEGVPGPKGRLANNSPDQPNPPNSTSQPPSLLDMLMKTGGSTGRPSLGPIPGMGMANMPASMWEQLTSLYGGPRR
jgi:hypothetical protein